MKRIKQGLMVVGTLTVLAALGLAAVAGYLYWEDRKATTEPISTSFETETAAEAE